jgi:hypothetical protein
MRGAEEHAAARRLEQAVLFTKATCAIAIASFSLTPALLLRPTCEALQITEHDDHYVAERALCSSHGQGVLATRSDAL